MDENEERRSGKTNKKSRESLQNYQPKESEKHILFVKNEFLKKN